jgi:predicted ArsR family transcriptional regulator
VGINRSGPGVTQRRVLVLTRKGLTPTQIARKLRVSPPAVFYHLRVLRAAGALSEDEGTAA